MTAFAVTGLLAVPAIAQTDGGGAADRVESLFDPPPPQPEAWAEQVPPSPGVVFSPPELPHEPANVGPLMESGDCPPGAHCPPGPGPWQNGPWDAGPNRRPWLLSQFDLRHSNTHGRAMGPGDPLRGTSWLNRPYALSLDGGALLMAARPAPNVRKNNDLLGAIGLGWDWDHYWGSQLRVAWSTPELLNTQQPTSPSRDNLFITDLSLLYYPWGDARLRPYYRIGVGLTDLEYTNDNNSRQHETLFTLPIGVGLKYQLRRWLAWRLELANNIAFGQNETDTLQNLTITSGLEWRYGGRPAGYWAWAPRGGGW